MTAFNLFDSLPSSLSCAIVSSWLDLSSIGHLDTAYCNHSVRPSLIDTLRSVECVNCDPWKCVLNNGTRYKVFAWLLLRGLKMSNLCLDVDAFLQEQLIFCRSSNHRPVKQPIVHKVIDRHGYGYSCEPFLEYMKRQKTMLSHRRIPYRYSEYDDAHAHALLGSVVTFVNQNQRILRSISLLRIHTKTIDFRAVGNVCKQLTSFACDTCGLENSLSVMIANNPNLEELRLRCGVPWDDGIAAHRLDKLRLLHLQLRHGYVQCCRDAIMLTENLQQLCLQGNNANFTTDDITFLAQHCPKLRSLGMVGVAVTDTQLATIVDTCRSIRHLDISQNKVVTDNGILAVAQSLHSLRSLNLQQCVQLTDQCLEHLIVHRAVLLEELCLGRNGPGITSVGVHHVQRALEAEYKAACERQHKAKKGSLRWYELCCKQAPFPYHQCLMATHLRVATDTPPEKLIKAANSCPQLVALHLSPNSHAQQLDANMLLCLQIVVERCPMLKTVYLSPFMYSQQGKVALLALYPHVLFMTDDSSYYYVVLCEVVIVPHVMPPMM